MDKTYISIHLIRVWRVVRDHQGWLSNAEIARLAGVADRTARAHTAYLVEAKLAEVIDTRPRRLYRVSEIGEARNPAAFQTLERASNALDDTGDAR